MISSHSRAAIFIATNFRKQNSSRDLSVWWFEDDFDAPQESREKSKFCSFYLILNPPA